jgi:hypothetical protein
VKISFSKTRSLEKKLREYAKMQDEKLVREVKKTGEKAPEPGKSGQTMDKIQEAK